ncbi:AGAP007955-PA, partial [Anopheles gambiae str. PEST]
KTSPSTSKGGSMSRMKQSPSSEQSVRPIQRKVVNTASSFPDKSGYLKLFVSRADLEEGIRDNLKVCLWRRDGSSLLQKYFRDKSVDANTPQFTSSMVYSCWEDKRADEYMEVKVRCIEQTKQLRVQIIDVEATEIRAKEEYQKYMEQYGKSSDSSQGSDRSNGGRNRSRSGAGGKKTNRSTGEDTDERDEANDQEEEE